MKLSASKKKNQTYYNVNSTYNECYYQFPKVLLSSSKYRENLSNDAMLAYMLFKERFGYSVQNNWVDEDGDIYFIFTNDELKEKLKCSSRKVTKIKKELIKAKLLEQVKLGSNMPNRLYLLPLKVEATDVYQKGHAIKTSQKDAKHNENLTENVDTSSKYNRRSIEKVTQTFDATGLAQMQHNKEDHSLDTIKDTIKDTEPNDWKFSKNQFTPEEIVLQNADIRKHISDTFCNDTETMFLNRTTIDLISLWFKTPEKIHDCISVILNAKNAAKKEIESWGKVSYLDFEDVELRDQITRTLRRCLMKFRFGKIDTPRNYLYTAMYNMFSYWGDKLLQAEFADKHNLGKGEFKFTF